MTLITPPPGTVLGSAVYPHRLDHGGLAEALHVHPDGNDNYDGASWGRAKKTILGAYDALPNDRGTIYIAPGSQAGGEVAAQGIWLAGPDDVNYASLPAGWRRAKQVKFIGVSATVNVDHRQKANVVPGLGTYGVTSYSGPWIWLSGVQIGVEFQNLSIRGNTGGAYGIDMSRESDGSDFTASYNCAGVTFKNVESTCSRANATAGYNALRVFGTFWVWIEDSNFLLGAETTNTLNGAQAAATNGTSQAWTMGTATPTDWPAAAPFTMLGVHGERVRVTAKAGTSYTVTRGYDETNSPASSNGSTWILDPKESNRAAIYLGDSDGSAPNYLFNVKNVTTYFGGIVTEGQYSSRFENIALESSSGSAIYFNGPGQGNIVDLVDVYDEPNTFARGIVEISPAGNNPSCVSVRGAGNGIGVYQPTFGPCMTMDGATRVALTGEVPPLYTGVYGLTNRRVLAQMDTPRRMGPSIAHHANIASHNPADWTWVNTTGVADVFGLTNAGTDTDTNALGFYSGSWNPSAPAAGEWLTKGDFVFFGVWAKVGAGLFSDETTKGLSAVLSAGTATFAAGPYVSATGGTTALAASATRGFNDWAWLQGFAKIATGGASTLTVRLDCATVPITACYPVVFTTSSMYDSEAWETFRHLGSIPSTAPAGHWSAFRGQKILAPGGIGVGNSAAATTPGSVVKKMEVFDASGTSLGFVPIYNSIT